MVIFRGVSGALRYYLPALNRVYAIFPGAPCPAGAQSVTANPYIPPASAPPRRRVCVPSVKKMSLNRGNLFGIHKASSIFLDRVGDLIRDRHDRRSIWQGYRVSGIIESSKMCRKLEIYAVDRCELARGIGR